jgi:hypothetical protein
MGTFVALDVSLQSISVHVVDQQGRCLWRGKCPTDVAALASTIQKHAPQVERVGARDRPALDLAVPRAGQGRGCPWRAWTCARPKQPFPAGSTRWCVPTNDTSGSEGAALSRPAGANGSFPSYR